MEDWEKSNRSWIPFTILIVLVIAALGYILFGGVSPSGENVRYTVQPSLGCVAIQEGGDPKDKVDIVFLPENYESLQEFRDKTLLLIDSFLSTPPYDKYPDRFNFYRIEDLSLNLNCNYKYGGDAIVCNPSSVKSASVLCPHDYPIVLVDVDGIQKFYELLRSSSWLGTSSLNVADDPLVFAHEFAHAAYDFADEYEYGGNINWKAPNCDPSWQTCPMFQSVEGAACVRGCVNDNHARSINVGIMRDYWKSKRYGTYNEYFIENWLLDATPSSDLETVQESIPLYSVKMSFMKDEWKVEEFVESEGFPDGINNNIEDSVLLLDGDGKTLAEVGLPSTQIYLDGYDALGNPLPQVDKAGLVETMVYFPIVGGADKISIEKDGEIVKSYKIDDLIFSPSSNSQSISIPELYES
jgi:hypothetical protein